MTALEKFNLNFPLDGEKISVSLVFSTLKWKQLSLFCTAVYKFPLGIPLLVP